MKIAILVAILISIAQPASASCDYDRQLQILALNMYHEARGEGPDGMQMVGEVTLNRVDHDYYPDNICDVVYQRRQFSWVHTRSDHAPRDSEAWETAVEIAEGLLSGEIDRFDNGATHFLNPDRVRRTPRWAREFDLVGSIGNHVFYAIPSQ